MSGAQGQPERGDSEGSEDDADTTSAGTIAARSDGETVARVVPAGAAAVGLLRCCAGEAVAADRGHDRITGGGGGAICTWANRR